MIFRLSLFFVLCCLTSVLSGQLNLAQHADVDLPLPTIQTSLLSESAKKNHALPSLKQALLSDDHRIADPTLTARSLMYHQHLAFFCRVEVKIDQAVKIPFRFRLGSVDYVDYLEGKRKNY